MYSSEGFKGREPWRGADNNDSKTKNLQEHVRFSGSYDGSNIMISMAVEHFLQKFHRRKQKQETEPELS